MCTSVCVCMCWCMFRLEVDSALSLHRGLFYWGRVSCWERSFPVRWASLPRGSPHSHPSSPGPTCGLPGSHDIYMSPGGPVQTLMLGQQACSPNQPSPQPLRCFLYLLLVGRVMLVVTCVQISVNNFVELVLAFHLFCGLCGPSSSHSACPASLFTCEVIPSKMVSKEFYMKLGIMKITVLKTWEQCLWNVKLRPANGVYRCVQGKSWEPHTSQRGLCHLLHQLHMDKVSNI